MAKDAINASISTISQAEYKWPFQALSTTQLLVVGQEEYAWPTNLKLPNWGSFYVVKDDALNVNTTALQFISRDTWHKVLQEVDLDSGADGISIPLFVFEKHGSGFGVSPSPDQAYTVAYDYWAINTALSAYNDQTIIPTNFDETIIQGALYHFYMFRDNTQRAQLAEQKFKEHLDQMRSILINKEDRIRSGFIAGRRGYGQVAIPIDGWYWNTR
jgi:hypothetical protein